jgi:hypothetical protein
MKNFLIIIDYVKTTTKLNWNEKAFISHILSFQLNDKECYESNTSISNNLGITVNVIKKMINKFNKLNNSFYNTIYPTNDSHIISIDIDKLNEFLSEPKEIKQRKKKPTSSAKANTEVLSNDNPISKPIPQQEEIVPQSEAKVSNFISSFINAIDDIPPQPKVEEIEDGILKEYKFYKNRLQDLFPKRRSKGEKIAEWECILYLKQSWDAGKITSTKQVSTESLNKVIDKFKKQV